MENGQSLFRMEMTPSVDCPKERIGSWEAGPAAES
jgi:hypothetical protein